MKFDLSVPLTGLEDMFGINIGLIKLLFEELLPFRITQFLEMAVVLYLEKGGSSNIFSYQSTKFLN